MTIPREGDGSGGVSPGKAVWQLCPCVPVVECHVTENPTLTPALRRHAAGSHVLLSLGHSLPSFSV